MDFSRARIWPEGNYTYPSVYSFLIKDRSNTIEEEAVTVSLIWYERIGRSRREKLYATTLQTQMREET